MDRYICIHGHFYQPPRENPWLETIEFQDSAHPYHDWNQKITAECYAPNARSRILDHQGRIVEIVNNYARMSFNFGPTLLAWLEKNSPAVYRAILNADEDSRDIFSGHGSALAQVYNHMILPLANQRDKWTQVLWGIRDFKHRFGRKPEGMWLPETAVDLETLNILAGQGVAFTILSPHQAQSIRPVGESRWQDAEGALDPTMGYRVNLPSGRSIVIFFYDRPISRSVAFERLLDSGESFVQRLFGAFSEARNHPQLVHIATDGESYGHHHRFGDMALAYALKKIRSGNAASLTNYGEYLEKHPPSHEVEIFENTSWSCPHGVERWRKGCGCHTGLHPEWNQQWRAPLRQALNWLRDSLAPAFENKGALLLRDPWGARNDYIRVVLDRSDDNVEAFLMEHRLRPLSRDEKIAALRLLEMQRHTMLMFTSCGWFFDELSGIETLQIMQYAGRAIQLAREVLGRDLESGFLDRLKSARSNLADQKNGRHIYEKYVIPALVDLRKACAYYTISSLFESDHDRRAICSYAFDTKEYSSAEAGNARLVSGRLQVISEITKESADLYFCVLHLGDHNITCGVHEDQKDNSYRALLSEIRPVFDRAQIPETLRILDRHFEGSTYSLKSLYRDEQQRILNFILKATLQDIESVYRRLYEQHAPIMRFLKDADSAPPRILSMAAELVLNTDLRTALGEEVPDIERIEHLLATAGLLGIELEESDLEFVFRKTIERLALNFCAGPVEASLLENLNATLSLMDRLPFRVNLWQIQNICYDILKSSYPRLRKRADQGEPEARNWVRHFMDLSRRLSVRLDGVP
jgi:alpha-amylase/alpha-mannosidase (GH57 family)